MVTILHFLLIIIIAFLLIVGMVAFRIYTRIRQHANRFKQQMNESFGNNQHSNGSYTSKQKIKGHLQRGILLLFIYNILTEISYAQVCLSLHLPLLF